MRSKFETSLVDLDSMLHQVASIQYSAGNHDNASRVIGHVKRYINTVQTNSKCKNSLMFYQMHGHTNFRNTLLPEYKGHREVKEAIHIWKPTILKAFEESGAIGLQHLESDDAVSFMAEVIGYDKVVIVTGDKDMKQVPTTLYDPFKADKHLKGEPRWHFMDYGTANRFLNIQILTGDPTDMSGHLCGIEGVGPISAAKWIDESEKASDVIRREYTKKYGASIGRARATITYKMVKLVTKYGCDYLPEEARAEYNSVLDIYKDRLTVVTDNIANMFTNTEGEVDLFFRKNK